MSQQNSLTTWQLVHGLLKPLLKNGKYIKKVTFTYEFLELSLITDLWKNSVCMSACLKHLTLVQFVLEIYFQDIFFNIRERTMQASVRYCSLLNASLLERQLLTALGNSLCHTFFKRQQRPYIIILDSA